MDFNFLMETTVMYQLSGICLLIFSLAGCGGDATKDLPKLGTVTGVIKLDDQPLTKAVVQFVPDHSRMSAAITDEHGKYELRFNDTLNGAAVGKHRVRITSSAAADQPEKLPAKYHLQTELTADVKDGKNEFNFDLKGK